MGVALITLVLLCIAVVNLFTKPAATMAGIAFSGLLFAGFQISEKRVQRKRGEEVHLELDKFNLTQAADLTQENVGVQPGNILVPVSTQYALYPLEAALRRAKRGRAEIVVLHVRMLRRAALGEYDLEPDQLFSRIEQLLIHEGAGGCGERRQAGAAGRGGGERPMGRNSAHRGESAIRNDRRGKLRE